MRTPPDHFMLQQQKCLDDPTLQIVSSKSCRSPHEFQWQCIGPWAALIQGQKGITKQSNNKNDSHDQKHWAATSSWAGHQEDNTTTRQVTGVLKEKISWTSFDITAKAQLTRTCCFIIAPPRSVSMQARPSTVTSARCSAIFVAHLRSSVVESPLAQTF